MPVTPPRDSTIAVVGDGFLPIENGGEFGKVGWSVAPDYQPLRLLAAIGERPSEGRLVRKFSSVHSVTELEPARPLSGVHRTPG